MEIRENEPLKSKTTMRIGGTARYFAELESKKDVEEAYAFAQEKNVPLIVLGAGANTIFADGTIDALVVRIKADTIEINENSIRVETGKNLAILINECAETGLDLSALTGIPGTVGGAIVGNAGQGPKGTWLDSFIVKITAFTDGKWKTFSKEECEFAYRESLFKKHATRNAQSATIIWEAELKVPSGEPDSIKNSIKESLKKRISAQPHAKTSGSCFKAADGTPAWELIDKAGLRDLKVGGVQISDKHANFLINEEGGSFADVQKMIEEVQAKVPELKEVEMRMIGKDGQPKN